ncbi:hypothetical protein D3C72_1901860 [compost metagenome]
MSARGVVANHVNLVNRWGDHITGSRQNPAKHKHRASRLIQHALRSYQCVVSIRKRDGRSPGHRLFNQRTEVAVSGIPPRTDLLTRGDKLKPQVRRKGTRHY